MKKTALVSTIFLLGLGLFMTSTAFAQYVGPAQCNDGTTDCGSIGTGSSLPNISSCTITGTASRGGQVCNSSQNGTVNNGDGTFSTGSATPIPTMTNNPEAYAIGEIYPNAEAWLSVKPFDDEGSASVGSISTSYHGCSCSPTDQSGNGCGGTGNGNGGIFNGTVSPGQVVNLQVVNSCAPNGVGTWGSGSTSIQILNETWCNTNPYYQWEVAHGYAPASDATRGYAPDPNTAGLCDSITPVPQCSISSFTANPNPVESGNPVALNVSVTNPGSAGWTITDSNNNTIGSGTGTSGTVNTGNLTSNQIYTLTCGQSTQSITVITDSNKPLVCTPIDQSATVGQPVTVTVSGGTPPYSWSGGGNPATANNTASFTTTYNSGNIDFINVADSSDDSASCEVDVGAAIQGTGSISANPNPCLLSNGNNVCTSYINWNTNNVARASVWITNPNGTNPQLFQEGPSCSGQGLCADANWITQQGYVFTLYDDSANANYGISPSGVKLASVTVKAANSPLLLINNAQTGSFTVGQSWQLSLTSAELSQPFTIYDYENGSYYSSAPGTTLSNGSWTMGGTFTASTVGSWMEYAQFADGTESNQVNFTVSNQPPPTGSWSCTNVGGNPEAVCSNGDCAQPAPTCFYGCVSNSCAMVPLTASESRIGYYSNQNDCIQAGCGGTSNAITTWGCQNGVSSSTATTTPVCYLDATWTTNANGQQSNYQIYNPAQQVSPASYYYQSCLNNPPTPNLCQLVKVSCSPSLIEPNQTSTCGEYGNGTASDPAQPVTWSLVSGEGNINSSGLYTAGPDSGNNVVQATSIANPGESGQATIQVEAPVPSYITVSCNPSAVYSNADSQCSAKVYDQFNQLAPNQGVTWGLSNPSWPNPPNGFGSISAAGLYNPPVDEGESVTVTAYSKADPTVTGSTQVAVIPSSNYGFAAECLGVNVSSTVNAGQSFSASVTMYNNSEVTDANPQDYPPNYQGLPYTYGMPWLQGTSTELQTYNPLAQDEGTYNGEDHLESIDPQDNLTWGLESVSLPTAVVPYGASTTFNFTAIAPSVPGTYSFDWIMNDLSEGPFPNKCVKSITVQAVPCNPVTYQSSTSGFSLSSSGASGNSITVSPGQQFYAYVDYGEQNDGIQAPNINGGNACKFDNAYVGTAARFVCTAPLNPATYPYETGTNDNIPPGSNVCASGPQKIGSVTVFAAPQAPTQCIFSALPTDIVPPGKSTLTWSCLSATSCTIDHGLGAVNPASGSLLVGPSTSQTYTLNCQGASSTVSETASVIVSSPSIQETNPGSNGGQQNSQ